MGAPLPPWGAAYLGATLLMWVVMMALMMLPSAVPVVRAVAATSDRTAGGGRGGIPVTAFVAGYVLTWSAFSILATLFQALLRDRAWLTSDMAVNHRGVAATLLVVAGTYQLAPWKRACLGRCRSPLSFLLTRWRDGTGGAVAMGVEHGLSCVGCCWALMLVLFVVGVMHVGWVVALAAFITLEKSPLGGLWASRAAGAGLTGWGTYLLVM